MTTHCQNELNRIKHWDYHDAFTLISYIRVRWQWENYFKARWGKRKDKLIYYVEMHTGGSSENEELINALMNNSIFCAIAYVQWKRGGHHYFEITPESLGYLTVLEMSRKTGITRHTIFKTGARYDWVKCGKRNYLIREINKNGQ